MLRYDIIKYHFSTKGIQMKRIRVRAIVTIWFTGLCFAAPHTDRSISKTIPAPQPMSVSTASLTKSAVIDGAATPSATPPAFHLLNAMQRDLQDVKYQQDILPNNFSYLVQLLDHGVKTNQNRQYAQDTISLFSKLLKGSEYVNSYVFSGLIEQMPALLKPYFTGFKFESGSQFILANDLDMLERLQRMVTSIVYTKFTQDFGSCKNNPQQFLNDLTERIVNATSQEVSIEQLRQVVIRFLEVGLSKLIWSPRDEEKTWESVKTISHTIATLMEYNIIDDLNDVDELFWTLVHRYRYFLELHSSDMPMSFYQKIKHDMTHQKLFLFELGEQESFLQSKSQCLLNTILTQAAKKQAYDLPLSDSRVATP